MAASGGIQWTSDDGELVFLVQTAADDAAPCDVLVTAFLKVTPNEMVKMVVPGNGAEVALPNGFNSTLGLSGTLRLVSLSDAQSRCLWSDDLKWKWQGMTLLNFEGCLVELPACGEPFTPQPEPILPDNGETEIQDPRETQGIPIVEPSRVNDESVFPYIYLRSWPVLDAYDKAVDFVSYIMPGGSPPDDTFVDELVHARAMPGCRARKAMGGLAQELVNETAFYGSYVTRLDDLPAPMSHFPSLLKYVASRPGVDSNELAGKLDSVLGISLEEVRELLASAEYGSVMQRVWDSYFALVIAATLNAVASKQVQNLSDMIQVLTASHFLEYCYGNRLPPVGKVEPEVIQRLAHAQILLPNELFPIPGWQGDDTSPPPDTGWIEPYSIGDLQLLKQRLLGYEAGDIAHIENVMAGERRKIKKTRRQQQFTVEQSGSREKDDARQWSSEASEDLTEAAKRTLTGSVETDNYDKVDSSYGPPTEATINGVVTRTRTAGDPGVRDKTRLAREVLEKSIHRLSRTVESQRAHGTMQEDEEERQSIFDNSSGEDDYTAVYRWLNKVYEAYVVNYGNRLMIEFVIVSPAEAYKRKKSELSGLDLERPQGLEQFGIDSYRDITQQNAVELAAYYHATAIAPAPARHKVVSVGLYSGEQSSLEIPSGYKVVSVRVACIPAQSCTDGYAVLVGGQAVSVNSDPVGGTGFGETDNLPVVALPVLEQGSPPQTCQLALTVDADCYITGEAWSQWQIDVYTTLQAAYEKRLRSYVFDTGEGQGDKPKSAAQMRQIQRMSLKQDCISMLLKEHVERSCGSSDGSLPPFAVNEPRYLQFFETAFEWSAMSYSFSSSGVTSAMTGAGVWDSPDTQFSAFLEAGRARVMVPVHPGREMSIIYYLATASLWPCSDQSGAVIEQDAALVSELKKQRLQTVENEKVVDEPWRVIVPTTMTVLDPEKGRVLLGVGGQ